MTIYRGTTVETEAMQWWITASDPSFEAARDALAEQIVAWVEANGGEARYAKYATDDVGDGSAWMIGVRTVNGWAYAKPGHYVVMGDAMFDACGHPRGRCTEPGHRCRDFYPCDPETFKRRWVTA